MSMIRINLIAEKRSSAVKTPSAGAGVGAEIQGNLILIILIAVAIGAYFLMSSRVNNQLAEVTRENKKLTKEYDKIKIYIDRKAQLELESQLLNEKIEKISTLKDRREGPVKLMEDVANALPDSVWLSKIVQGYEDALVMPVFKQGFAYKPESAFRNEPANVVIEGRAKTPDSVTNFSNKILSLDKRYTDTTLNHYERKEVIDKTRDVTSKEYEFTLFFKIKNLGMNKAEEDSQDNKGKKR